MKLVRTAIFAAALVAAAGVPVVAPAAAPPIHIRGTIVSSTASSLTVKTASGAVTVALGPKVAFAGATTASTSAIAPGKFLGIASVPGTGPNRALEVVVFADSMRGVGEGDYAWDGGGSASMHHSTMTNGTVAMSPSHSTMTNATVGTMSGAAQKTITMNYKGGSRTIVVPANAPVVAVAPGSRALLEAGSAVFVIATAATPPAALFVIVGKDGTALPM